MLSRDLQWEMVLELGLNPRPESHSRGCEQRGAGAPEDWGGYRGRDAHPRPAAMMPLPQARPPFGPPGSSKHHRPAAPCGLGACGPAMLTRNKRLTRLAWATGKVYVWVCQGPVPPGCRSSTDCPTLTVQPNSSRAGGWCCRGPQDRWEDLPGRGQRALHRDRLFLSCLQPSSSFTAPCEERTVCLRRVTAWPPGLARAQHGV